jgi:S1-C subfamily serine protease
LTQEGSGFVVGPDLVLTNAHVIAGVAVPDVIDSSGPHPAVPVVYDPVLDVAVLRVQGRALTGAPLKLDPDLVARNQAAAVLGFPGGGSFTYGPAGVMAAFQATGWDIYGNVQTTRSIYEIDAVVRPGNSGGPLVEPDQAEKSDARVSTEGCTSG